VSSAIRLIETTSNPGIPKPVPPTINSATNYCAEQLRVHDFCIFDHHRRREISAVICRYRLEWAVLQLCRSSLICLGRCSLHHRFPVCSSGGNSNRRSFSGVSLVSAFFLVVPGPRGVAGRAGPPRRSRHGVALGPAVCPEMERRLHSRLRPTNDSWRVDETYIRVKGKWVYLYRAVDYTGATIDFLLSAKRDAAAAERFLAKDLGRREPSGAAGHQHRRARRLSAGHHAAQGRGGSGGELPASTGAISEQPSGKGSSGDQTPDTRKPPFSLVPGSLAHDRRLRSDPYDPQRPGARKCAGGEGRSTPSLHSWFVQRGGGLILRTLSPNFALTPKLQHHQPPKVLEEDCGHAVLQFLISAAYGTE